MTPTAQHIALMNALKATLGNEGKEMDLAEILAIACQFVGNLTAMMDQREYDSKRVMNLVVSNIQIGNGAAVESLMTTEGSA